MRVKLIYIYVVLAFFICGCSNTESKAVMDTLSIAEDSEGYYEIQTDGQFIYLADIKQNSKKQIRQLNGSFKEVLRLPQAQKRNWSYLNNSDIPNPRSFSSSIHSPATYNSTLQDSSDYLLAMSEAGWELVSKQGNYLYLDMYFLKDKIYTRVIVLENRMKIFQNASGSFQDSWTYINQTP